MIRNKRELQQIAAQWMGNAKADLRNKMAEFVDATGASAEEIADMLDVNVAEITAIMNGNGNIRLSTFAKLLIATDNVIEIKPIAAAMPHMMPPMGGGRTMGGFPLPCTPNPTSRRGARPCDNPRVNGVPRHNVSMTPFGGFAPNPDDVMGDPINDGQFMEGEFSLDELDRKDLIDIIVKNGWERGIDINRASRSTLIDFIESRSAENAPLPTNEEEMVTENVSNETREMADWLADELERNPHLKETIRKYMR